MIVTCFNVSEMAVRRRYAGHDLAPHNVTSYLSSRQLRGRGLRVPRRVQDRVLLSSVVCTSEDEYPAIGPDMAQHHINPEPPTYCLRFCPVPGHQQLLGLANEDGRVAVQDTSVVTPKIPMTGQPCHDNAIFDLSWSGSSAATLVTVSGDQKVRVWDVAAGAMTKVREFTGHQRSVKCVEWRPGSDTQLVTGARDNCVMLWDTRDRSQASPDNVIRGVHSAAQPATKRRKGEAGAGVVTCLAWLDTNTLASAGDKDGVVKLWDLRKNYSLYRGEPVARAEFQHPGDSSTVGYTSLAVDPEDSRHVYAACMDDKIYRHDTEFTSAPAAAVYTGASIRNFFIKMSLSPCGRYLACGSADNYAYVWNVASAGGPVARLGEMAAEVTCVSWCGDTRGAQLATLATASDDMRHQLWRQPRRVPDEEEVSFRLQMLDKQDDTLQAGVAPLLPATPRRSSTSGHLSTTPVGVTSVTPRLSKNLTPTIKSFLTPTSAKKGLLTPNNEDRRGLKRRQCSFNDENSAGTEAASRNLTASISSLLSSPSSQCSFTPESYRSPTKRVFCSPVKTSQVTPRRLASPLKLFSPLREIRVPQSPTANLPNFNIDGRSPRTSGVPRMKERKPSGANWLTAYAKEKKQNLDSVASRNKLQDAIGGLSSKSSQGFQKLTSKKGTKKKVVKLK